MKQDPYHLPCAKLNYSDQRSHFKTWHHDTEKSKKKVRKTHQLIGRDKDFLNWTGQVSSPSLTIYANK